MTALEPSIKLRIVARPSIKTAGEAGRNGRSKIGNREPPIQEAVNATIPVLL